ncbi:hypothetical protein N9818_00300 [Arcobacteraceae bacterium]|nr:hypothetical protein [Arcobacteraceae bacterium]
MLLNKEMEDLKSQIIENFTNKINALDFSINETELILKYNSIVDDILHTIKIKKEKIEVPLHQTSNNNDIKHTFNNTFGLSSGKSDDVLLGNNSHTHFKPLGNERIKVNESTIIPSNFSLTYEMKHFAKSKFVQNIDDVFEDFKLYYESKSTLNTDWESVWKRWVRNQNKYKSHLVKTTISENLLLDKDMMQISKKYINKEHIELEFIKFKNHYIANGDLKVSWEKVWENWCINHKQFKPKEQSQKSKEKSDYRWDFRKAKDTSDRIKEWLEFEKGIKWLEDFYLKDMPIPGIGWKDVMHPDFNKEEILLFKIDSENGQYMLKHSSDDIIEAEVQEHD